ncbi:hypothetical protein F5X68DRAFT_24916 [Plectosphaerella plurivora]|uniref:Uncharacterized protein n=1 Tax=Plectosphaerella plurivora TaxID=936078 RepID=A0A9P8V975_9PEZI|nr:hypothetical protein F5X68DRAFT_24916 [Plectosphaerella plurivora]
MRLPPELLEQILLECVNSGDRAACRELRLISRLFDSVLKPHVCRTVCLSFRHINRAGIRPRPRLDALDTVGTAAKVLNIDMSAVRDQSEIDLLNNIFDYKHTPCVGQDGRRRNLVRELRKCLLGSRTCDEGEYSEIVGDILRQCDNIRTLRLVLPNPIVSIACDAPTRVLTNTIKALAATAIRCLQDGIQPIHLAETLVLENITHRILYQLFRNPVDIGQHHHAFRGVKNLVLAMRNPELLEGAGQSEQRGVRAQSFWSYISLAGATLESICITCANHSPRSLPRRVATPSAQLLRVQSLASVCLPPIERPVQLPMTQPLLSVTRLELKGVTIESGGFLRYMTRVIGPSLRELYFDTVLMNICPPFAGCRAFQLWIGVPNRRPHFRAPPHDMSFNYSTDRYPEWWAAPLIRDRCPRLEIVRATDLCYVSQAPLDRPFPYPDLDTRDPSGLGRTIAQRFVEVVLGYDQPDAPPNPSAEPHPGLNFYDGGPSDTIDPVLGGRVRYWPYDPDDDSTCFGSLKPRSPGALRAEDHDLMAYRLAGGANTTSRWLRSVDGAFPNVPAATDDPAVDGWIDTCLETLFRHRHSGDPRGDHLDHYNRIEIRKIDNRWSSPTSEDEWEQGEDNAVEGVEGAANPLPEANGT